MATLKNPRHEKFTQELAQGKPASEAYVLAGYKADRGAASRLSSKVSIKARVIELQAPVAAKAQITLESLTEMYLKDRDDAKKAGQHGVAVRAADSLAKMYGHFIERHEHGAAGDFERMTDEELRAIVRRAAEAGGLIEAKIVN
jgi:hypothetical protein